MNYTFSVSCLCVLYSLSLVSSQCDLPTDVQNTNSPRLRALTPYNAKPDQKKDEDSGSDKDDNGFCVLSTNINSLEISENGKPAYPESPKKSPITLATRQTHRRALSGYSLSLDTERAEMPSSPRHWRHTETPVPSPLSSGSVLGSLQQQRERDGLPVMSSIEHSNAVQKEATTPTSDTFSQMPPSAISTFAGLTLSGLTQRRNSGSPKNKQREQVLNGRTNVQTTPPHSSAVALIAAAHRYQLNETMTENPALQACANQNRPFTTGQPLVGADFIVVDLEEKTCSDLAIPVKNTLNPKPAKPSCFEVLCCCCSFKKTKKR